MRIENLYVPRAAVEPTASGFDAAALWVARLVWRRALAGRGVGALLVRPRARDEIKPSATPKSSARSPR